MFELRPCLVAEATNGVEWVMNGHKRFRRFHILLGLADGLQLFFLRIGMA